MGDDTKIEWADHTFNAWIGCTKVSPACDHCYAEDWSKRYGRAKWGPGEPRERTTAAYWRKPLKWDADAKAAGAKRFVFCNSLADVFDNEVSTLWRADLFDLIARTPNLVWLLLTKRVGNVEKMGTREAHPWPANAWLGATVVNQAEADRDIPKLLAAKAALKIPKAFLSIEPMLGAIDLREIDIDGHSCIWPLRSTPDCEDDDGNAMPDLPGIDWVICGGESGKDARPMHPDWARSLRDQCAAAGVPFMMKQWGEWRETDGPKTQACHRDVGGGTHWVMRDGTLIEAAAGWRKLSVYHDYKVSRLGKARAGRLLDGVEHNGRPAP